jgi:type IV secretory pathway VirB3-like protein
MSRICVKALLLVIVLCFAVCLFLFMPLLYILEICLIVLAILVTVWAVSQVDDQIHLHRVRRQIREANLRRMRRKFPPRNGRY